MPEVESPSKARSRLASAHITGRPDPEVEEALRCNLALSNLDAAIRKAVQDTTKGAKLDDVQVSHLCGLVMGDLGGVGYDAWVLVEPIIRAAVRDARAKQAGGR